MGFICANLRHLRHLRSYLGGWGYTCCDAAQCRKTRRIIAAAAAGVYAGGWDGVSIRRGDFVHRAVDDVLPERAVDEGYGRGEGPDAHWLASARGCAGSAVLFGAEGD